MTPASLLTHRAGGRLVGVAGALGMVLSGTLVLAEAGYESGPNAFVLAVLLAIVPVPLLAAGVLWLDRFEPEPPRVLAFTFLWGASVACFAALVLNSVGEALVGSSLGAGAAEIYGGSISAPVVEETAKAAAIWLLVRRRRDEIDGVLDGIVYAGMVGLGFAMTENVLYYGRGAVEEGVPGALATFAIRGVMSPFAHPVFTAATGIGIGLAVRSRRRSVHVLAPATGLAFAMGLHALWNTAAAGGALLVVYALVMVPVFAAILLVARLDRSREQRVVRRHLPAYVAAGWLAPGAAEELASPRRRRAARRAARTRGGRRAARDVRRAQLVATELAFLRDRRERGLADDAWQERERAHLDALAALAGGAAITGSSRDA